MAPSARVDVWAAPPRILVLPIAVVTPTQYFALVPPPERALHPHPDHAIVDLAGTELMFAVIFVAITGTVRLFLWRLSD